MTGRVLLGRAHLQHPHVKPAVRYRAVMVFLAVCTLPACVMLSRGERLAGSTLGCVSAAVKDRLGTVSSDAQAHCQAAGLIARHCSVSEAYIASIGKELRDLLGPGRAQWNDLVADRRGIRCARSSASDAELEECCRSVVGGSPGGSGNRRH
jgi:hypothetical protein